MPLKGAIQSMSARIPLYERAEDVPTGDLAPKRWALVSDTAQSKGLLALEQAAEELGVERERFTVFSEGQEGDFWVVSAGYETKT